MKQGLFIVLDGLDGSGKATQAALLVERLMQEGVPAEKVDFPRYGTEMFGALVGECLAGKHGDFLRMSPKIASTLYALDRFEASKEIRELLQRGITVVSDRFTSSNKIHQGGKVADPKERSAMIVWIDKLEHEVLSVPRPDATLYLHVPIENTAVLLAKKRAIKNEALGEQLHDVVENDLDYAKNSYASACELARTEAGWHIVECAPEGSMRTPEAIHEDVYALVAGHAGTV